jgi:hypothetical protein
MNARKFTLLHQVLLAATLATGFATFWLLLSIWLSMSILASWAGSHRGSREDVVVASDGTPLISNTTFDDPTVSTYRDLTGRAHAVLETKDMLQGVYLVADQGTPGILSGRLPWEQRLNAFVNEREPEVNWFFMHDGNAQGAGYFVAFHSVSNRRIGFIGLSGFRSEPVPESEWIPVRGELIAAYSMWSSVPVWLNSDRARALRPESWDIPPHMVYVPSGQRLVRVDLGARTIESVFESPEPIVSMGVPILSSYSFGQLKKEQPILVRTKEKIYALDHNHKVVKVFVFPTEIDRESLVRWYETADGAAIVDSLRTAAPAMAHNTAERMVYRVANDGKIENSTELTLPADSRLNDQQGTLMALAIPAPAVLVAIESVLATTTPFRDAPAAVRATFANSWPGLAAVVALSCGVAAMAWRRSCRFGQSRRDQVIWSAFVFLFGVPAYVGFLLHRRWPIRESCPNCHAQAARDRPGCAECGTRFPEPAQKGTEIFA